jgi:hypothetical protein
MPPHRARPLISIGAIALLLVAGIGGVWLVVRGDETSTTSPGRATSDFSARFAGYEPALEPNGDLAKVVWPEFVLEAGDEVRRLYEFQVENGDLMRFMPCFCGCGQSAGHRNNRDCYIRRVNPDGSVVFDEMAPT